MIRGYDARRPGAGDDFGPVDRAYWRPGRGSRPRSLTQPVGGHRVAGPGAQLLGVAGRVRHRRGATPGARFGQAGTRLHEWFVPARAFRAMAGQPGGSAGIDDALAGAWAPGTGAEIMGRAKSGPHRGPWPDRQRTGWRGDDPPFRAPVLVRTRPLRPAVRMNGGTRSGFPDASPARAVAQPRRAAAGAGVRIGGGPAAIREFLAARPDRLRAHRRGADRAGPRGAAPGRAGGARRPVPAGGRDQPRRRHPRHPQPAVTAGSTAGQGAPEPFSTS